MLQPNIEKENRVYWILHYLNEEKNVNNSNIFEVSVKDFYSHLKSQDKFTEFILNKNTPDFWDFELFLSLFAKQGYIKFFDKKKNKVRKPLFEASDSDYLDEFKDWYIELQDTFSPLLREYNISSNNLCFKDIVIDLHNQLVTIGGRTFESFDSIFDKLRIRNKATLPQLRGGVGLIYAITKYLAVMGNQKAVPGSELLQYYKEFRESAVWSHWKFEKRGYKKMGISKTDCDSANRILIANLSSVRFKPSKDGKNIVVKD